MPYNRYVTWPGQAVAYAVGEERIWRARRAREGKEGFDLRRFHADVILCAGPMSGLEDCLRWREAKRRRGANATGSNGTLSLSSSISLTMLLAFSVVVFPTRFARRRS